MPIDIKQGCSKMLKGNNDLFFFMVLVTSMLLYCFPSYTLL